MVAGSGAGNEIVGNVRQMWAFKGRRGVRPHRKRSGKMSILDAAVVLSISNEARLGTWPRLITQRPTHFAEGWYVIMMDLLFDRTRGGCQKTHASFELVLSCKEPINVYKFNTIQLGCGEQSGFPLLLVYFLKIFVRLPN